jgi:predicted RNase H-like nuclease
MSEYVGLDWAGKGWFGVVLKEDGEPQTDLYPSILSVWKNHSKAERILIDIPIGLSEDGQRACDEEAEEMLNPYRHNSVFSTPIRDAVYAKTLAEAKELNEECGFILTAKSSWN